MSPACIPVTREPTVAITEPGSGARPRSRRCSASGSRTTRNPSTFARIHPGRSTTATRPTSSALNIPVTWWTGSATATASSRNSPTTALASARLTWGPGRTHLTPVEIATSQSIICPLFTPPRYVLRAMTRGPAASWPVIRGGRRGLTSGSRGQPAPRPWERQRQPASAVALRAAAAAGQRRGHRVNDPGRMHQLAAREPVGHEREREQPAVGVADDPGQADHPRQVARLGPHGAERRRPEVAEDALSGSQRPGETGDRHPGDGRAERGLPAARQPDQPGECEWGDLVPWREAAAIHQVDAAADAQPRRGRRYRRRSAGERGGPAGAQRDLPGQVLGDHVVALAEHPAHVRGQGGGADSGDRGGARRCGGPGDPAVHADAAGAQERGKGCRRVGRRGEGARPEVAWVVGVLRLAGPGQPALIHLERGDGGHVAGGDVTGGPARRHERAGEQRDVIAQPHRPLAASARSAAPVMTALPAAGSPRRAPARPPGWDPRLPRGRWSRPRGRGRRGW